MEKCESGKQFSAYRSIDLFGTLIKRDLDMIRQSMILVNLTFTILLSFCNETLWATEPALVTSLSQLVSTSAWQVNPGDAKILAVSEARGNLVVHFKSVTGNRARLLLKDPIPVPDTITGLTFLGTTSVTNSGLWMHALVKDARGHEFLFYTKSPHSYTKGLFLPEQIQRRSRQVRFTVPGFLRPVGEPRAGATLASLPPAPSGDEPQQPLTLLGFALEGEHQHWPDDAVTDLYLQGNSLIVM